MATGLDDVDGTTRCDRPKRSGMLRVDGFVAEQFQQCDLPKLVHDDREERFGETRVTNARFSGLQHFAKRDFGLEITGFTDEVLRRLKPPYDLIAEWSQYVPLEVLLNRAAVAFRYYNAKTKGPPS